MNPAEISRHLSSCGIRPSPQRSAVYGYLCKYRNHPTAETIFRALSPDFPTLSRTTVYNTLKLFVERHAVQAVLIEDGELRFDADTTVHGHFKCECCGRIYDFPLPDPSILPTAGEGFQVEKRHLYYLGICKDCGK
ncbi:MAG: transcriptional repressor [Lentisphaeria bacterium]|nr:transcriptional repressor [Lentisphaeria bacterium]